MSPVLPNKVATGMPHLASPVACVPYHKGCWCLGCSPHPPNPAPLPISGRQLVWPWSAQALCLSTTCPQLSLPQHCLTQLRRSVLPERLPLVPLLSSYPHPQVRAGGRRKRCAQQPAPLFQAIQHTPADSRRIPEAFAHSASLLETDINSPAWPKVPCNTASPKRASSPTKCRASEPGQPFRTTNTDTWVVALSWGVSAEMCAEHGKRQAHQ